MMGACPPKDSQGAQPFHLGSARTPSLPCRRLSSSREIHSLARRPPDHRESPAVTDPFSSLRGAAHKEKAERETCGSRCPPRAAPCASLSPPSCLSASLPLTSPLPGFGLGAGVRCPQVWGLHACSVFLLPHGSCSLKSARPPPQADLVTAYTQVIRAKGGADSGHRAVALSEGLRPGCVFLLPTFPYSTCASEPTEAAPRAQDSRSQGSAAGKGAAGQRLWEGNRAQTKFPPRGSWTESPREGPRLSHATEGLPHSAAATPPRTHRDGLACTAHCGDQQREAASADPG